MDNTEPQPGTDARWGADSLFFSNAYHYRLPLHLIAQEPLQDREQSRLMVLNRRTGQISDSVFSNLRYFLRDGDLLVVNNSKVFPARLIGHKQTGGRVELLLLRPCCREGRDSGCETSGSIGGHDWECLLHTSGRVRPGQVIVFAGRLRVEVIEATAPGIWRIRVSKDVDDLFPFLDEFGQTPLPPYIKRSNTGVRSPDAQADHERYQTIFARLVGSAAAPTAGLHFSHSLCSRLREEGVRFVEVTLHVGEATFLPIRAHDVRKHFLRPESFILSHEAVQEIDEAKRSGRRVVAVGTTVVRCLESVAAEQGRLVPGAGLAGLYLVPGCRFQVVDALITNFHIPRSSLLVLVCAFAGREAVLKAYRVAVRKGYRFFSYGDCMLIQ